MKRFGVALVMALAGAFVLAVSAFAWQQRIEGQPASFERGATGGYYIWHDDSGLHLRTTDPEGIESWYAGVITTDGTFHDVALVMAERDDHASADGAHTITFAMHTFSGIDGFDFQIDGGTYVRFDLYRDGNQTSPDHIFLGEDGVHPDRDPFVVTR